MADNETPGADDTVATPEEIAAFVESEDPVVPEEPAPTKPRKGRPPKSETPAGMRTVTAERDLRVVTKDLAVIRLQAGVPRTLPEKLAFAAQGCAAEQRIKLTMD